MAKVQILGAGMIGSTMALDLARDESLDVSIADCNPSALRTVSEKINRLTRRCIKTETADLADVSTVRTLGESADIVLGALPSVLGYAALEAVIETATPYVDISFMSENALQLNRLAEQRGTVAVVDCGVAPGLSNMLAGAATTYLDACESIEIYVGGLPRERVWPFEYKAAFAPYDVIEEYTRPARLVESGEVVVREALSEPELMDFSNCPGIGTLEAFNTDGLRTLIDTLNVPDMKEKTLRYQGHIALMRALRETGYFGHEKIKVGDVSVRPIDLTSALLFPKWKYREHEQDVTLMRISARGTLGGEAKLIEWNLFDQYDVETGCSSMSRTTAFPATLVARALLAGKVDRMGVLPPEVLGMSTQFTEHILSQLMERGVRIERTEEGG